MPSSNGDILLVSDEPTAAEVRRVGGGMAILHLPEPYRALEELARHRHGVVVVSEDVADVKGFARAAHRLGPGTRVYALCTPAGEAELRASGLDDLDDYFLFPPTRADLEQMVRAETEGTYEPVAPAERAVPSELSAAEIAALIESAETLSGLTDHLARLAGGWIGAPVSWAHAAGRDAGEPLLLLDGSDGPKVLLGPPELTVDAATRGKLAGLQALAGPLAGQARRAESLHRLAITDFLTGAYNRRYLYHFTDRLLRRAGQEKFQATVLLYDIDDFKRYNDTYGHAAGDEILCEIAALMKKVTREHDLVARIGGDEFAVLFWDAEPPRQPDSRHPEEASVLADRFLEALSRHEFAALGPEARGVL
ncbi:MAG: GGDEF domain-containing protein, partial [Planctomycetota bacterium]